MSYIGTPPSNAFTSLLKQDFSTSATTGYTLDHAVNNANDIALFINFVRQEPTAGYAASGTTLTLTSATASSDDMYCVYLGQALQTVNPANASVGISQLSATGTKNSTTFLRGDNTFAAPSGNIVNLGTTTVTGTPSEIDIDFDTSTYKQFRIFYEGIQATADFNMYARAKVGGSIITASNYNSATVKKYATGFDTNTYGGNNQAYWYVTNNIGGDTNENWGADILINIGSGTGMPQLTINCAYRDSGGLYIANWGTLTYQNFSIINGFRIYPSTGTFDTGKYTVWGIK